jgi:hypothetical protein
MRRSGRRRQVIRSRRRGFGLLAHRLGRRRHEIFVAEGEGRVRVFEAHRIGFSGGCLGSRQVTEIVIEEVEALAFLRITGRGCRHRFRRHDRSRLSRGGRGGRRWSLGEQAVHLTDEGLGLEGLGHVTRCAGARSALFVEGFEGAGEKQYGNVGEVGVGFDCLTHLVAVLSGHHDVGEDQVRTSLLGALQRVVSVVDGHESHVLARKTDIHDLLDRDTVIRQQQRLGHVPPPQSDAQDDLSAVPVRHSSKCIIVGGHPEIECFSRHFVQSRRKPEFKGRPKRADGRSGSVVGSERRGASVV